MSKSVQPKHGALVILETAEKKDFMFNPKELSATLGAEYARRAAIAGTFQRLHYKSTKNVQVPLTLTADRRMLLARRRESGWSKAMREQVKRDFEDYQRFIMSMVYPVGPRNDILRRSPPDVLVYWPNVVSIIVKVMQETFRWTAFDTDGHPVACEVQLSLEEKRNLRMTQSIMRRRGLLQNAVS